jgi:hypothetical protein
MNRKTNIQNPYKEVKYRDPQKYDIFPNEDEKRQYEELHKRYKILPPKAK